MRRFPMKYIENKTLDEIKVGDSTRHVRTLTMDDIDLFAIMSGDINPAHVDEEYARSNTFHKIIAHGMGVDPSFLPFLARNCRVPVRFISAKHCVS
jgi:acyl dehydratase